MAFPCPCCGHFTLPDPPPGTFDICPVCTWEDDHIQFNIPSLADGANAVSLSDARRNFKEFGAKSREFIDRARIPKPEEIR
jgi:hypothetical protein